MNLLILQYTHVTSLHLGRNRKQPSSLSSLHNIVSLCNGYKSVHTKVKHFVLQKLLYLCMYVQSCIRWSHMLKPQAMIFRMLKTSSALLCLLRDLLNWRFSHSQIYFRDFIQQGEPDFRQLYRYLEVAEWGHTQWYNQYLYYLYN